MPVLSREWIWRLVMLGGTVLISYFSASAAVNDRVTRIETRTESQFQEILRRFDADHNSEVDFHSEIRSELRSQREQVLQIIKEMKR